MAEDTFSKDIRKGFDAVAKEAKIVGVQIFINEFLSVEKELIDEGKLHAADVTRLHDVLDEAAVRAGKRIREEYE
jgi:hypothetical protein